MTRGRPRIDLDLDRHPGESIRSMARRHGVSRRTLRRRISEAQNPMGKIERGENPTSDQGTVTRA